MSDIGAPLAFEMVRRAPSQRTAGLISGMTGYRRWRVAGFPSAKPRRWRFPLIISFGTPFLIALGREPDAADRQRASPPGSMPGRCVSSSDGGAECVQVDFTPLGAYRFFGGAVVDLAARMVDIGDVLGHEARSCASEWAPPIAGSTASTWSRTSSPVAPIICHRPRSNSPIAS